MSMKITITVGGRQSNFLLLGDDVCKNLAEVKEFCSSRFQQLENENGIKIFWKDQDGDEISVVKEVDFRSFMLATENEKVRLYVEATDETAVDPGAEHPGIQCDECEQGIVGHRYKCLMCDDYDLCMTCESKHRHKDHMMVRFPRSTKTTQSRGDAIRVSAWIERMGRYAKKIDLLISGTNDTEANGNGNGVEIDKDDDKIHGWGPRELTFKVTRSMTAKESHLAHGKPKLQSHGQGKHKQQSMSKADVGASSKMRDQPKRPREKQVSSARSNIAGFLKHGAQSKQSGNTPTTVYCPEHNTYHVKRPIEKPFTTKEPKESTSAVNTATGGTQQQSSSKPTSPTGSVVTGLVDGVLKHTPPEWNKFLPTEEEMNRLSSKVSGLLSVLGLEVTMPPTGAEVASKSSGSSYKETERKTSEEEKDPQSDSKNSAKEEEPEKVATNNPPEITSVTKKALQETDNVVVNASQDAVPEEEEVKEQATESDDCSADTSSASMLTDDDEDVIEAAQVAEQNASPQASSSRLEIPWIMVDLPDDREEEVKQAVINTTSSVPVASGTPASSPEKVDDKQTPKETSPKEQPEVEEFYANTFQNMVDLVKQLTVDPNGAEKKVSELIEGSQKEKNKLVQDDRYKAHLEKAAKELEKHLLEIKQKEETERQQQQQKEASEAKDKGIQASSTSVPSSTTSPARLNSMADAFTMSRTRAVPLRMYSRRPHVNHAIQTMMTMGFSNHDGRLTHLLETLNGDIPRALDRLMQNMS
ncbi:protein ref(2)P-like [Anopheles ziemanni]|uniref:protein ref(2)P-like n=1 Tax=Anopheles coustani TaxID=139045 RepID=UPI002659B991|nr:protein ref(2)P-like [Anopheles coustani]XP_058177182.1 protein ref(2)P-like [Anopheles ziemanni]